LRPFITFSRALELLLRLQGGNNIHAKGISEIAQVLKDNTVITTVSPLP